MIRLDRLWSEAHVETSKTLWCTHVLLVKLA